MAKLRRLYQGPLDLLKKAENDFSCLSYAIDSGDEVSVRVHLFNFSVSCYHVSDWLKAYHHDLIQKVDDELLACDEMKVVRDVCNASKHVTVDNPKRPKKRHPPVIENFGISASSAENTKLGDGVDATALESSNKTSLALKVEMISGERVLFRDVGVRVLERIRKFFIDHGLSAA